MVRVRAALPVQWQKGDSEGEALGTVLQVAMLQSSRQAWIPSILPPGSYSSFVCLHLVHVSAHPQGSTAAGAAHMLRFALMGFVHSSESKN